MESKDIDDSEEHSQGDQDSKSESEDEDSEDEEDMSDESQEGNGNDDQNLNLPMEDLKPNADDALPAGNGTWSQYVQLWMPAHNQRMYLIHKKLQEE